MACYKVAVSAVVLEIVTTFAAWFYVLVVKTVQRIVSSYLNALRGETVQDIACAYMRR